MLIGAGEKYIEGVKNKAVEIDKEVAQFLMDRTVKVLEYAETEFDFYQNFTYVSVMLERLGLDPTLVLSLPSNIASLNKHDFVSLTKNVDDIKTNLINKLLNVLKETNVDYNDFFIRFQYVNTVDIVNKDKTIKDEYLDCFTAVHDKKMFLSMKIALPISTKCLIVIY